MHLFTKAFAVGYYYGRAYGNLDMIESAPEEDQALFEQLAFKAGREAGVKDFEELDLLRLALEQEEQTCASNG